MGYTVQYTATVTAFEARQVRCEHCGEVYVHDVKRKGVGSRGAGLFMDHGGARDHATLVASAAAQRQLRRAVELVPCPTCGSYQPDMVALLRRRSWRSLRWLGWAALVFGLLNFLAYHGATQDRERFLVLAVGSGGLGVVLLLLRLVLAGCHDPNRGDPEPRKQLGRGRAYRPQDADQVRQDRQEELAADRHRERAGAVSAEAAGWLFFGLVALGVGAWLGLDNAVTLLRGHASVNWPTARGTVTNVSVQERTARRSNRVVSRSVTVHYAFTVNGSTYSSDNLWFGWSQHEEQNMLRYPRGRAVTVSYDPADPRVCALEPGVQSPRSYYLFNFAVPLLLGGLVLCVIGVSRRSAARELRRALASPGGRTWRPAPGEAVPAAAPGPFPPALPPAVPVPSVPPFIPLDRRRYQA